MASLHRVVLEDGADLAGFRQAVRRLIAAGVPPDDVVWTAAETPDLLGAESIGEAPAIPLSRSIGALIEHVVCHCDPQRYACLYSLIWRVSHGQRALLDVQS